MKDIIQSLAKTDDEVYAKVGTVEKVDTDEKTCDVIPLDGSAKLFDVYLQADGDNGGILQIPKVGSLVCVIFINKETAVITNTGEIEVLTVKIQNSIFEMDENKLTLKKDNTIFEIDQDGFLLKKENETMKKLVADLITAVENMSFTVSTTGSATAQTGQTTLLNNTAEFSAIKNRFNQFLK